MPVKLVPSIVNLGEISLITRTCRGSPGFHRIFCVRTNAMIHGQPVPTRFESKTALASGVEKKHAGYTPNNQPKYFAPRGVIDQQRIASRLITLTVGGTEPTHPPNEK